MWKGIVTVISALVCLAQWMVLAQFPIHYESNEYYWLLLLLYVPVAIGLLVWSHCTGHETRYLWLVWLVYTLFLVFTNAVVLGLVETQLSTEQEWGPHVLEMTLSLASLLLFLLLFVTAGGSEERRQFILISFRLSLDLFDIIDMLGATLEKEGRPRDAIPQEARIVVYTLAIVALLMSTFELWSHVEREQGFGDPPCCCTCFRTVVHILINLSFLILRGIFWSRYHRPAPLFMAKSFIYTVVHIIEMAGEICWKARRKRLGMK